MRWPTERLLVAHFSRMPPALNENRELPSLFSVGGDWDGIVALIERGEVFYSKLYRGRVTYLSRALYEQVRPYKQRPERLRPGSAAIFEFFSGVGLANTAEIKAALCLSGRDFSERMDELFRELLITAVERDRTISQNWSSFRWGTYRDWENRHPLPGAPISVGALRQMLGSILTNGQIRNLLK